MIFHNRLSKVVSCNRDIQLLFDRLLWLRGHYDAAISNSEMKSRVINDVDIVLDKFSSNWWKK